MNIGFISRYIVQITVQAKRTVVGHAPAPEQAAAGKTVCLVPIESPAESRMNTVVMRLRRLVMDGARTIAHSFPDRQESREFLANIGSKSDRDIADAMRGALRPDVRSYTGLPVGQVLRFYMSASANHGVSVHPVGVSEETEGSMEWKAASHKIHESLQRTQKDLVWLRRGLMTLQSYMVDRIYTMYLESILGHARERAIVLNVRRLMESNDSVAVVSQAGHVLYIKDRLADFDLKVAHDPLATRFETVMKEYFDAARSSADESEGRMSAQAGITAARYFLLNYACVLQSRYRGSYNVGRAFVAMVDSVQWIGTFKEAESAFMWLEAIRSSADNELHGRQ
ncbi:MAG: hypothetical protein M1321_01460 [Candidatus Marsarchaeota archaeon]|nr:hypothetical protein [Candidatus Marsarchaeota archaeon]